MSQQAVGERVYGGEREAPECPDPAEYVVMYMGVNTIGMGKSFDGKPPQEQLVLDFKIDAENPQPGTPQEGWQHFDFRGYFTPILHYDLDLPDYAGRKYTEPNLYKLVRAMNGGIPLAMPTAVGAESGKTYYVGYTAYEAADILEQFVGRRFKVMVGPNDAGWPRFKSDPLPLVAPGTRRRGQQAQQTVAEAAPANGAEADPFVGAEETL